MKTSELTGAALDWAVHAAIHGACEGYSPNEYSTNWSQGGPIIEREGIDLYCNVPTNPAHKDPSWRGSWRARYHRCGYGTDMYHAPTPRSVACRCYVASKLGEEVEVPYELR